MEESSSIAVLVPPTREQQDAVFTADRMEGHQREHRQAADSLIQVIEKLSRIVEKRPRRCTLSGRKRPPSTREASGKKAKDDVESHVEQESAGGRAITCYQCSLCKYVSPTLSSLKDHLRQHNHDRTGLVLVCSECCFTSHHQEELEAHIRLHLDSSESTVNHVAVLKPQCSGRETRGTQAKVRSLENAQGQPPKKWYSYEKYGMYRCLICSYVCGQQRMLKTHAWKHAGLVDCSYPVFEDETDEVKAGPGPTEEAMVVVAASVSNKPTTLNDASSFEIKLCAAECKGSTAGVGQATGVSGGEVYASKEPFAEEPAVEVQVTTEQEAEPHATDSLLSSAQKIMSCSPNGAGHVNVIVERMPGAGDLGPVGGKPFLVEPRENSDGGLLTDEAQPVYFEDEEVVVGWCGGERAAEEGEVSPSPPPDENVPPGRRRTYSESLRLHSLAAEVLVAMPTRALEPTRTGIRSLVDTGQGLVEIAPLGAPSPAQELVDLEHLQAQPGTAEGPAKMGISVSLLAVIEKLRERTDQNATDEDILKELQDNAQGQPSEDATLPETSLVEFIPGSERPYRCRLCRYTSGNKGYIKQHLRVHRQRQPYQCPICDLVASDSKDLENHMINHCKTRMYHCKQCSETFYYKSHLRSHEREQHGLADTGATLMPLSETAVVDESKEKDADEDSSSVQKIFKCDMCDYTSSTYVGVRNHRRIHTSDKPYRCCSCDFATTNMNSLKSHMRRHPQEHQAVQLMEQYRCSLCGYVCSHPPSLKSHMWKHAGDQNYNYEQVNKAINEAISQSSRSSSLAQKATVVVEQVDKALPPLDPPTRERTSVEGPPQRAAEQPSLLPTAEHCVLLFCCCICGFESANKERLMEHMKEHEGEIISIILSKEQQGGPTTTTPPMTQ
ncbi:zinc finger protein 507 [Scleropages formosus]|uniref:Zinc finger protein 507 n=1 Tax=Scleropages formosus TaxID=113540 RepID=A0A8C9V793_SCLFO|nr:zinc finger protein 507 [Scleropages formosus]